MKILPVVLLGIVLAATVSPADQIVELDLDGVPWNGPDTVDVVGGDSVDVDVWYDGPCPMESWVVVVCNPDQNLSYITSTYSPAVPSAWTKSPPEFPSPDCVRLIATDFTFGCIAMQQPVRVATITYQAAVDNSIGNLDIDPRRRDRLPLWMRRSAPLCLVHRLCGYLHRRGDPHRRHHRRRD